MPYTMTSDETAKCDAMRTALTTAKQKLDEAADALLTVQNNADALMAIEKAAGRADSYNAAFKAKADAATLRGETMAGKGRVMRAHAEMSTDLQRLFVEGPAYALAGPWR